MYKAIKSKIDIYSMILYIYIFAASYFVPIETKIIQLLSVYVCVYESTLHHQINCFSLL